MAIFSGEILLICIVLLLVLICTGLVVYARWNYGTLEANGIPVVKPHWFLGSNYNYTKLIHHVEDLRRAQKLGLVYGVYNGRNPEVFVLDPEILRLILLKQSDYFTDKTEHDFGHPISQDILEFTNGDKSKFLRGMLSPLFTSGKIKQLSDTMVRVSDEYISVLSKEAQTNGGRVKADFRSFLPPFAIELIGQCFCGITLENARDPKNVFVNQMKVVLWDDLKFDWTFNIINVFPFLLKLVPAVPMDVMSFFEIALKNILDGREKSGIKIPDAVNTLLEMRQRCNTDEYKRLKITLTTVYGQAFLFFIASYFGIVSIITYFCYHLAMNPDISKRLMEEMDAAIEKTKGKITFETVHNLEYLTACISETFRTSSGFFRTDRVCTKDWEYKGYKISKGMRVVIPIHAIHQNPEIYPEPEKFNPDRFLGENKAELPPCSFMSFGQGHRQCLGIKFANELLKIFFAHLLREFRIEKRKDTVWKDNPGNHILFSLDPIYVDFVKR